MDVYDYSVKVRKKIPFRTSLRKEQLIYDFCSLVAENFKNHKNVGFYADKLNITTTYLSAIMNERCGISAKEFLSIYIVLEVKSLLRDSRSVSYTHLDVYKRQPVIRSFERFNYTVLYHFMEKGMVDDMLRQRMNELLHYMNM